MKQRGIAWKNSDGLESGQRQRDAVRAAAASQSAVRAAAVEVEAVGATAAGDAGLAVEAGRPPGQNRGQSEEGNRGKNNLFHIEIILT